MCVKAICVLAEDKRHNESVYKLTTTSIQDSQSLTTFKFNAFK